MAAFKKIGVKKVIGFASVGGMKPDLSPGLVVVPDDYFSPWAIINLYNDKNCAISELSFFFPFSLFLASCLNPILLSLLFVLVFQFLAMMGSSAPKFWRF